MVGCSGCDKTLCPSALVECDDCGSPSCGNCVEEFGRNLCRECNDDYDGEGSWGDCDCGLCWY